MIQLGSKKLLVRYIVVGAIAYLIEMVSLISLRIGLKLSPVRSVAISFWVGFAVAFLLQKLIAFENHDKRAHIVLRQLFFYSLLVAFNYSFTLVLVDLLKNLLSVFIIRTLAILIITCWNFMIYKYVFKSSEVLND